MTLTKIQFYFSLMYIPRSPTYTNSWLLKNLILQTHAFILKSLGLLLRVMPPITSFSRTLHRTWQPSEVSKAAAACHLTKVVKGGDYVHRVGCVTLPMEPSTDGTLGCQISPLHCTALTLLVCTRRCWRTDSKVGIVVLLPSHTHTKSSGLPWVYSSRHIQLR